MQISQAYIAGFRKFAEDSGLSMDSIGDALSGAYGSLTDWYHGLDPEMQKSVLGGTGVALGAFLGTNGSLADKLVSALGFGAAGGFGIHHRKQLTDPKWYSGIWNKHFKNMFRSDTSTGNA